jgi:hypothetical protein
MENTTGQLLSSLKLDVFKSDVDSLLGGEVLVENAPRGRDSLLSTRLLLDPSRVSSNPAYPIVTAEKAVSDQRAEKHSS